jgi:hypothetical protein
MFWDKKKQGNNSSSGIILGMIMLKDIDSFDPANLSADFKSNYGKKISIPAGTDSTVSFSVDGETIAIAHMPVPIPFGDIEQSASLAYNWVNALKDISVHKSHLIVPVMQGTPNAITGFRIFTRVLSSLLRTTNSIGVYQGNQSLLIPKQDYLNEAALMDDDYLPLNLWLYFGLRTGERGNSGYTYGMKEFGKMEMEVVNVDMKLEDIRSFLFNVAHYVLKYDITLKDGETCGMSEKEKIAITLSRGIFVEGNTLKLAY